MSFLVIVEMANLRFLNDQLLLRPSDAAVAFTVAKGSRGAAAAAARAKMPEEVEKEAKARVVSHCTEWVNDKYIFH